MANAFGSRFAICAAIDRFFSDPTSSVLAILRERIAEFLSAIFRKPGDISLQLDRNVAVEVARRALSNSQTRKSPAATAELLILEESVEVKPSRPG
jgi:hypothetical protein